MSQLFQNPFVRKSREEAFWEWFKANAHLVREAETGQEDILHALYSQLNKVQKGLTFELGPISDNQREFIISADGIRERFPAVQKLVAAAPEFPDWEIIAFRQPKGFDGRVQFGDIELSPEDIWFSAHPEGNLTGLKIFLRGLSEQNKQALAGAAFILLDSILGEYALETRVGTIEWEPLPHDPEGRGLKQLKDLPKEI
jgi:hypothetical protein